MRASVLYLLYFIFINFVDPRLTDRQTAIATYITAIAAKYIWKAQLYPHGFIIECVVDIQVTS